MTSWGHGIESAAKRVRVGALGAAFTISVAAHAVAAGAVALARRSWSPPSPSAPAELEIANVDVAETATSSPGSAPAQHPAASSPRARRFAARRAAATTREPGTVQDHVVPLAEPTAIDSPEQPFRFAMSAATVANRGGERRAIRTEASAAATGAPGEGSAVGERDVDVPARLLQPAPIAYPAAARTAEVELDLPLEIVVDEQGRVVEARVLTRAGYGLDDAAVRAIAGYRFAPAVRAGRPVRVRMRWTIQFRLS